MNFEKIHFPKFAIQVSRWVRELALCGSVKLGQEKSHKELHQEFRYKIGLDVRPYDKKDVVYFIEFRPVGQEIKCEDGKFFYKFGVSSDVCQRLVAHEADKTFENPRMDRILECKSRSDAFGLEKKIKRISKQMGLLVSYMSKKECIMATEEEYECLIKEVNNYNLNDVVCGNEEYNENCNEENNVESNEERYMSFGRYQMKLRLLKDMLRDGELTLDQFTDIIIKLPH